MLSRASIDASFSVSANDDFIDVVIPAGATTGKVTVTTPNGQAVSEFAVTMTAMIIA